MEHDIQTLPWMGDDTRKQALAKPHAVVNKIGYPDKWRDYSVAKDRNLKSVRRVLLVSMRNRWPSAAADSLLGP